MHVFAAGEFEDDSFVVGVDESAFEGFAVEGGDGEILADVFLVLSLEFERRVEAGAGDIELEVFDVAVEAVFDGAAELDAVVDGDAVVAVDGHIDAVVGGYFQVDKELVGAAEGGIYNAKYV